MVIKNNISSIGVLNEYRVHDSSVKKRLERLSSGMRINKAGDDPAGLAVSEKMRSQISGIYRAMQNTQDGIHFMQTTESWVSKVNDVLGRLRELAVQSANGIYTYEDRLQIQEEVNGLVNEVDRISQVAQFNNLKLLRGAFRRDNENNPSIANNSNPSATNAGLNVDNPTQNPTNNAANVDSPKDNPANLDGGFTMNADQMTNKGGGVFIHVGANMDQRIRVYIENLSTFSLGLAKEKNVDGTVKSDLDYTSAEGANQVIGRLDKAISTVLRERANLGAYQNRLEQITDELSSAHKNMQMSESYIRDANIAEEMTHFVRDQILFQTSSTMLVNSNLRNQIVLKLLGS